MAKKTNDKSKENSPKASFDFAAFDAQLSKIAGFERGSLMATNTYTEVDEYIPTGNYLLNALLSGSLFGGIPNSRSVGLIGDPETGKTFLCLNFVREAQKMGYHAIYCESEGAVDRKTVARFGVDTTKMRYEPTPTVNHFKKFAVQVIKMKNEAMERGENPKLIMFLDSLGMLGTEKELNDALAGKDAMDMGIKAKQLRAMFRATTLELAAAKIPLIVTNHTTIGNIGSYTGPTKESAGGDGPIFSLSSALLLSKKFEVMDSNKSVKTGIIMTIRPKKSRSTIPTTINIHVGFVGGMNPFVGLEEYCSWDACGIGKGKIVTAKEYAKSGASNGQPFQHTYDDVDKTTGEIKGTITDDLVFIPNENARWCVKHMGKSLPAASYLFNKQVFTEQVLRDLDNNVIKDAFMLPDYIDQDQIVFGEDAELDAE